MIHDRVSPPRTSDRLGSESFQSNIAVINFFDHESQSSGYGPMLRLHFIQFRVWVLQIGLSIHVWLTVDWNPSALLFVVIWISLLALRFIEESEEFQGSIWWKESVMECGVCGSFVSASLCSNNWDPTGADWSTSNDFSRISSDLVILEGRRFLSLIFTSLLERPAERKIQSEIHFWINRQLKWR